MTSMVSEPKELQDKTLVTFPLTFVQRLHLAIFRELEQQTNPNCQVYWLGALLIEGGGYPEKIRQVGKLEKQE